MNYLFLSINYFPEPTGFAPHVTAICESLVNEKNTVNIITGFPFSPNWQRWHGYKNRWKLIQNINGVIVRRITHFIPRHSGRLLGRVLMELTFCIIAFFHVIINRLYKYDLIVYVGAQPSIAFLSRILSKMLSVPYIVEINDLASEAAVDVKIVQSNILSNILKKFEYWSYNGSSGAVVLCSAFREALIKNGYSDSKIKIIRSPTNLENIRPIFPTGKFRNKYGFRNTDLLILYSGSMGLKQNLINVINTAVLLKEIRTDIKWVLVGDGEQKQGLINEVFKYSLKELVYFLPFEEEKDISQMFADADILLLNQLSTLKNTVVPSKLLTYMAAGKPILAAVNKESQGAAILKESGGGFIIEPENPNALCDNIRNLKRKDPLFDKMGTLNREYAEKYFDQNKILAAHMNFFNLTIGSNLSYKK